MWHLLYAARPLAASIPAIVRVDARVRSTTAAMDALLVAGLTCVPARWALDTVCFIDYHLHGLFEFTHWIFGDFVDGSDPSLSSTSEIVH
jgi:hypothetical protein